MEPCPARVKTTSSTFSRGLRCRTAILYTRQHMDRSYRMNSQKRLGATATTLCQAIVGSVVYLTRCTRHDICHSVNQLTRAGNKPAQTRMTAAKHALRHLKGHPDLPIIYKRGQFRLHGYTDASFAANPDTQVNHGVDILPDWRAHQLRLQDTTTNSAVNRGD